MTPEMWNTIEAQKNNAVDALEWLENEFKDFSNQDKKKFANHLNTQDEAFDEFKNWDNWEEVVENEIETSTTEEKDSVETKVKSPEELAFRHMINDGQIIGWQFISPVDFKRSSKEEQIAIVTLLSNPTELNKDQSSLIKGVIKKVDMYNKFVNEQKAKKEAEIAAKTLHVETVNSWINQEELKNSLSKAVPTSIRSVWKTTIDWTDVYFTIVKDIRNNSNSMDNLSNAIAADNGGYVNITPETYTNEEGKETTGMNFSSAEINGTKILYTAIWKISNNTEYESSKEEVVNNETNEAVNINIDWDKPSLKDILSNLDKAWDTDNPSVKKLILWWKEVFIAEVRESKAESLAMKSAIMQLRKTSSYPVVWTENFTYNWKQYVIPNLKQLT